MQRNDMSKIRIKVKSRPHATFGRKKQISGPGALMAICSVAIFAILYFLVQTDHPDETAEAALPPLELTITAPGNLFDESAMSQPPETKTASVKPGQTLASLLGGHLSLADIQELAKSSRDFRFRDLQAGNPYRLRTRDGEFEFFEYRISPLEKLLIYTDQGEYRLRVDSDSYDTRTAVTAGTIENSLFDTVKAIGEDPELAVEVADIFAWDIDFCRDLRKGDVFSAVVEKRYLKDKFMGYGRVLATTFVNQGVTHQAFYFETKNGKGGYYDANGQAARKAFLRAPLSFRRISSGFTHRRLHPILKVPKPHLGIDYAAPAGTPVWSVGDGVVIEVKRNKAAGNYVVVRHSNAYVTRYNHLSRYATGLRKGKTLTQGQVLGYVGSTGYATGPHLDFRMYLNGKPINALKNDGMYADPVPASQMAAFKRTISPYLAALDAKTPVALVQLGEGKQ